VEYGDGRQGDEEVDASRLRTEDRPVVPFFWQTCTVARRVQGGRQRFKRRVGSGTEDQELVSASATAKHASFCRCAKRKCGTPDHGHPLPSSRPLLHSLCDHTRRLPRADGEAGKSPCLSHKCRSRILGRESGTYLLAIEHPPEFSHCPESTNPAKGRAPYCSARSAEETRVQT
jgi:hypothetical protein